MICRILLFAALLGVTSSCKDFLDIPPRGKIAGQYMYQDLIQARWAVYSAYEQLSVKQLYGDVMFDYYHMDTDECRMTTGDPREDWRNFCLYSVSTTNPDLLNLYTHLYRLVNRVNDPIANIPKMDIWVNEDGWEATEPSDDLKTLRRLYAEAIFLRAIAYNDLMNFFGDVPAKFTPSTEEDEDPTYNLPRENRDLIYDQIITDMLNYVKWLPWANEVPVEERVTQGAGRGLLARIALRAAGEHLYWNPETYASSSVYLGYRDEQEQYSDKPYLYTRNELYEIAQQQCLTVIKSNVHSLQADYGQMWKNLMNSIADKERYERMFEVGIYRNEEGGGYVGSYNSVPISWSDQLPYGESKNYVHIMPNYFAHFNQADSRMMVTCWPVRMDDSGMISDFRNGTSIHSGKFRRWWIGGSYLSRLNTNANWCMLRYPDVLLMYAEATLWLQNGGRYYNSTYDSGDLSTSNPEALKAFNMVRRRAFRQPIESAWTGTGAFFPGDGDLTSITFKDIMYERWFEFGGENVRKWDLFRWGLMDERLKQSRKEMANIRYFGDASNIPATWYYTPERFIAPYNQAFIDAAAGNRPYRYYWSNAPLTQGEEPVLSFADNGTTRRNLMQSLSESDINMLNDSGMRGVARFFTSPLKKSLVPIPQNVLDNSSNMKQSPFL